MVLIRIEKLFLINLLEKDIKENAFHNRHAIIQIEKDLIKKIASLDKK